MSDATLKSAKGHAKNARNQLESILTEVRKGEQPEYDSVEYALEEVRESIDRIEEEIEKS